MVGTEKNLALARDWYVKAAEEGDAMVGDGGEDGVAMDVRGQ